MTTHLNPAWQRRTLSSDHLAKVSAGFLSDSPSPEQTPDGCQVISFLLNDTGQEWVVGELCAVLTQRGRPCRLQAIGENDADASDPLQAGPPEDADFCLFTTTSAAALRHRQASRVVLLVPANLDGVMSAYRRIKLLAGEHTPGFGVVIVGPRDQHAAWRYFRKLAVGTLRFLDIPLLNLGFLPQEVTPERGQSDHHRYNFLTRIGERLLRCGFHAPWTEAVPVTSRQPAP